MSFTFYDACAEKVVFIEKQATDGSGGEVSFVQNEKVRRMPLGTAISDRVLTGA